MLAFTEDQGVSCPFNCLCRSEEQGKKGSVKRIPVPKLNDNEVLIKVYYAAQVR